jgi:hypothetical protein
MQFLFSEESNNLNFTIKIIIYIFSIVIRDTNVNINHFKFS